MSIQKMLLFVCRPLVIRAGKSVVHEEKISKEKSGSGRVWGAGAQVQEGQRLVAGGIG